MKIVEFAEVSEFVKTQLKAANLYPVTLTREDGSTITGYLVEDDELFWGVKVKPVEPTEQKKD